ncbi:hypothetical protein DM860_017269 [Cuscuta australis]|uniref:HMA domain-containing protein n=1 Tax=Cuscuta australis TaxID=267555 RepID=A0A328E3Q0_9ASTE|nr:hypothetical protein DM860_017269 [Cuscuta australis]
MGNILSYLCNYPEKERVMGKGLERLQTVAMMVEMDCHSCEWRARTAAKRIKGVTRVDVDADREKMTVVGYVDPVEVLEKVRRATGKRVEYWRPEMEDLRPCSVPAAAVMYETRDPSPRHVRNVVYDRPMEQTVTTYTTPNNNNGYIMPREPRFVTTYGDEDVACQIM